MSKFCELTKNIKHIGEVSTGRVDGSPSGAVINVSTNENTGETRDTLTGKLKSLIISCSIKRACLTLNLAVRKMISTPS